MTSTEIFGQRIALLKLRDNYLEGSLINLFIFIFWNFDKEDIKLAAQIVARYSGGKTAEKVTVEVENYNGSSYVMDVVPMLAHEVKEEWHI